MRWLIQAQIDGAEELNFDPGRGAVRAPVVLWGPDLWADGTRPRATDGLRWPREDLAADGSHPGPSGARKVGTILLEFFRTDPTARPWFVRGVGGAGLE